MRRFITLATIAAIAAAVVTQWQRVKELGRQVLSGGTAEEMSVSAEENKAVVRREIEEIFTQGNLDAAEDVYAPNYYSHQPAGSEDISGLEAIKQFAAGVRQAFPDMEITLEDQIAEGDKVVTRFTSRGTHQGELWGIPATGKEVEVTSISMDRIEGGKIAEHWTHADQLGMMQQLGVVPTPGEQPSSTPSAGQEPPS
jgi:steroid delta-isomerase-like uncharacterized protein